jgi:hypothetical protein
MTGRHKFSDLEAGMSPQRRARIEQIAEELATAIDASELPAEARRQRSLEQRILELLRAHPNGLTRAQIIEKLRMQEDREAERSILDTLTELTRTSSIFTQNEKYCRTEPKQSASTESARAR